MKAFVHEGVKGLDGTKFCEVSEEQPKTGEVKVKLKYAGLNHRELFLIERRKRNDPCLILGSDGTGIIEEIGTGVENLKVGDEVVINPGLGWEQESDAPPKSFEVLGTHTHGTFAEKINISSNYIEPKPKYLSWEEAGVLPLAGLTAYRALFTRAQLKPTDTVLLPGVGSGVVTFLLLFAKSIGARVIVTSRSELKRKKALELGADVAIDTNSNWNESLNGEKVDIVIETIGQTTFNKSINQLRKGGTIVTLGVSSGPDVTINIRHFFHGQFNLLGTTMGSREEFKKMLQFVSTNNIKPVIDKIFRLNEAYQGLQHMNESGQFGKIGLKISSSSGYL